MNKLLITTIAATTIIFLTTSVIFAQSPTPSEEEATSSANIEEKVKENVMKLLQGAKIKGDTDILKRKTALFGTLKSVANTTLSIDTPEGIQLASASAVTTYVRLPGSKAITFEDLAIDDYIIALGFINGSDVLDARRILTQKEPPAEPDIQSFFGIVDQYTLKTYELILKDPVNGDTKTFAIVRNTDIYQALPDGTKDEVSRSEEILPGTPVLAIYSVSKQKTADSITPLEILMPTPPESSPSAEPTPQE